MGDSYQNRRPVYRIRVSQISTELPFPVTIVLPIWGKTTPDEERKENTIYAEDFLPRTTEHYTILGQFVDYWGYLETVFTRLMKIIVAPSSGPGTMTAIFQNLGMKQAMAITQSLATARLDENHLRELVNLLERLSSLNSKRNILVHGHWCLEIAVLARRNGDIAFRGTLLREIQPADHRINLADLRNQKERSRHTFNTKRIAKITEDAQTLALDIDAFQHRMSLVFGVKTNGDPHEPSTDVVKGLI